MKSKKKWFVFLLLLLSLVMAGTAVYADITATYTLRKSVVGGGGHQGSTGGVYTLSGTAGQAATQSAATGGGYSLASGFWIGNAASSAGTFEFMLAPYSAQENAGTATITVIRSGGSDGAVSVQYATNNGGTATAGSDYTATSGTLNFADSVDSQTFTITIIDDNTTENDETVNITLSNPTGGASLGSPSTTTLTIQDNDTSSAGKMVFANASRVVRESDGNVIITIFRIDGSTGAVSVRCTSSDGTATNGSDYTASSVILNFADGVTALGFSVPVISDNIAESDETVILTLTDVTGGATLGSPNPVTLTITEADYKVYLPMIVK